MSAALALVSPEARERSCLFHLNSSFFMVKNRLGIAWACFHEAIPLAFLMASI